MKNCGLRHAKMGESLGPRSRPPSGVDADDEERFGKSDEKNDGEDNENGSEKEVLRFIEPQLLREFRELRRFWFAQGA
jgi:hypothetical protein